jgi:tRNA1Val (adenine37-N6)-methyltransferase
MGDSFSFRRFTVNQSRCAMKTGTDGVTLGAWIGRGKYKRILDVGTGTGLIALMAAQVNVNAIVDAIDVDVDACRQALENVEASPFCDRISVVHKPFSLFVKDVGTKYDLIVSNPPYFVDSLKGPDSGRNIARHDDMLTLEELVEKGRGVLSPGGRISLIMPVDREREIRGIAVSNCMNMSRTAYLYPRAGAGPKRLLVEMYRGWDEPCIHETITILSSSGSYTAEYLELRGEFF